MLTKLHEGEKAIQNAPLVTLKNGENCIPQHYLTYAHTLESVQKIILNCYFDERYPIFVGQENNNIYIQIGIIGFDNYKPLNQQTQKKIVYGRKWRVEPELPTSEIIQTVFLAIKVAREHEIRELFTLSMLLGSTTPFNNHHDLPLMAKNKKLLELSQPNAVPIAEFKQQVESLLPHIKYDHGTLSLLDIEQRKNGQILIDLALQINKKSQLAENTNLTFTLIITQSNTNEFLFLLMEKFIQHSHNYVEEHFTYQGFHRFSRENNVQEIAELSINTRNKRNIQNQDFLNALEESNYATDKNRVPVIVNTELAQKIAKNLSTFGELDGVLPNLTVE